MMIEEIKARLQQAVPELNGNVEGAAELASLVRQQALPQRSPYAFVLPLGNSAEPRKMATGLHIQNVTDAYAVVLVLQSADDATGAKSLPSVDGLADAVESAIAGFTPSRDGLGASFDLVRERLVSLNQGTVFYQLEFSLRRQLRI